MAKLLVEDDLLNEVVTINGMRYSHRIFEEWADGGLPIGTLFRIISRDNGVVAVERISEAAESLAKGGGK